MRLLKVTPQSVFLFWLNKNPFLFLFLLEMAISKFPTSTELDINKVIQQYFLHARDRIYKRQKPL